MIQEFQRQLVELLRQPQSLSSQGERAAIEISQRLELKTNSSLTNNRANPLAVELDYIAKNIDKLPGKIHALANTVIQISDQLPWYQRPAPEFPAFGTGHANAEIIGPKGMMLREDVIVGVTIMRSGLKYPDHHHLPEEIYIALSEGLWRQNDNPWKSPGLGGFVYNQSDILHSMKSTEIPLFAIWCLKP